jgi:hypothetical protein
MFMTTPSKLISVAKMYPPSLTWSFVPRSGAWLVRSAAELLSVAADQDDDNKYNWSTRVMRGYCIFRYAIFSQVVSA